MSFILDALKKSEQQRQKQDATPQQVRKRTLSHQKNKDGRWFYPALAGGLFVVLLCAVWFTSRSDEFLPAETVEVRMTEPAAERRPEPRAAAESIVLAEPPQQEVVAPSAPVPRSVTAQQSPLRMAPVAKKPNEERSHKIEPVEIVVVEKEIVAASVQVAPQVVEEQPSLPVYLDLSRGLRSRMPRLDMSMHYYLENSDRCLVRINDRIFREGDWIDQGLRVVEITSTGAVLEFLGKAFVLQNSSR